MHIETIVNHDGKKGNNTITINKLFQFIIVKDIDKKNRKIIIYNAIIFHAKSTHDKLNISFKYNLRDIPFTKEDCSHFFQQDNIIQQFWGKDSKFYSNMSDCLKNFHHQDDDITSYLNKENSCHGVLYIEQNEKPNIGKFIVKPIKIATNDNSIILPDSDKGEQNTNLISRGYWFKSEFDAPIEDSNKHIDLIASISLKGIEYKSPDFKIYLQADNKYELKRNSVEISYSKNVIDRQNCEILKVFSQSKMTYFDDWRNLGIYQSALFRTKMNSVSEESSFTKGISKIEIHANLENSEHFIVKEINLIIFSLFLSLFLSLGFDITRQENIHFSRIFPESAKILTIDALWFLCCLSLLFKYIYARGSNIGNILIYSLFSPLILWQSLYIFHPTAYENNLLLSKIYYFDIIFGVLSLVLYIIVLHVRKRNPSKKKSDFNRFEKFIGV